MAGDAVDAFVQILQVVLFLFSIWMAGRLMRAIGASPIIGEIVAGILLGPHVADIAPYAHKDADGFPSVFVLAGNVGVTLMIMLSGMHIDFEHLKKVGKQAVGVAVIGTLFPIGMGVVTMVVFGVDAFPDALSAGITLGPTSVGIAIQLLTERKVLSSEYGQTILAAAFVDDLLSLLALVILQNLAKGSLNVLSITWPIVAGVVFLGFGAWASQTWFPPLVESALSRVRERVERSHQPRDELQLALQLITLVVCGSIAMFIGSHLLGAFVAGILFGSVPRSPIVWRRQLKRVSAWLLRLFFASTVAFSIPTEVLFSWDAIGKGAALTVFGALLPKFAAGIAAGRMNAMVVGCAMLPRGEFAYFVAAMSVSTQLSGKTDYLMSNDTYAAVVWALLASAVIAPIAFQSALTRRLAKEHRPRSASIGKSDEFGIRVEGVHRAGLLPEVIEVLNRLTLEVREAVIETDGKVDVQVFTVQMRDRRGGEVDDEKLSEIKHEILDAVNDPDAQVVCIPTEPLNYNMLEIQLTCSHFSSMLTEVTEVLNHHGLEVKLATCVGTRDDTDVEVLYAHNLGRPDTRVGGDVAYHVRTALRNLLDSHNIKGEVMVKPPKWSQIPQHAALNEPRAVIQGFTDLMKVAVEADSHHPVVLHEVAQALNQLGLDVVTADIEAGDHDTALFYVKAQPGSAHNSAESVQQALMDAIRAQQVDDCHVVVEHTNTSTSVVSRANALAAKARREEAACEAKAGAAAAPASPSAKQQSPAALANARRVRVMNLHPEEAKQVLRSSSSLGSPFQSGASPDRAVRQRAAFEEDSDSDVESDALRLPPPATTAGAGAPTGSLNSRTAHLSNGNGGANHGPSMGEGADSRV